nr:RHS repeat-associated core domain-containing protein [uncultured Flavobacterium sp.]
MISKGKFTKHYFEGAGRIVSKLGNGSFAQPLKLTAGGVNYGKLTAEQQKALDNYVKTLGVPPGPPTQQGIYATPEFTGDPYPSEVIKPVEENQEPPEGWPRNPIFNAPGDVPGPPVQFGPPVEPETVKSGEDFTGIGLPENDIFYFHPDHLGSTSYITAKNGSISQHVEYIAFGEVLFEEHSSSFSSPYLFNGKELDRETNLSYYGARYLDMKTSLWLSVDPLTEEQPNKGSYQFCSNNPINLIDPDGRKERPNDYKGEMGKGDWRVDDRINGSDVWKNANSYNLQQEKGYNEYTSIEQRTEFYKWFQNSTESKGYDTKWAGAAFVIAAQMSNIHSMASSLIKDDVETDVKAFAEAGNKAIFNDVFPKLKKLYNGPVLKGDSAYKWDSTTLHNEQFNVVGPIYKQQRPEVLNELSYMAKGQNTYFFPRVYSLGVPIKLRFNPKGNIRDPRERFAHGMNVAVPYWNKYYSKKR